MDISKETLALFKQCESEEAGQRKVGYMEHDKFLWFLLHLYLAVKGDSPVLTAVRKKAGGTE